MGKEIKVLKDDPSFKLNVFEYDSGGYQVRTPGGFHIGYVNDGNSQEYIMRMINDAYSLGMSDGKNFNRAQVRKVLGIKD